MRTFMSMPMSRCACSCVCRDMCARAPVCVADAQVQTPVVEEIKLRAGQAVLQKHAAHLRILFLSLSSPSVHPAHRESIEFEFPGPIERERFCASIAQVLGADELASPTSSPSPTRENMRRLKTPLRHITTVDAPADSTSSIPPSSVRLPSIVNTAALWSAEWPADPMRVCCVTFNISGACSA